MESEYITIVGTYPGMVSYKFYVRADTWQHWCDNYMNFPDQGNCYLPAKDAQGNSLFVDMTKLLSFSVSDVMRQVKTKKTKKPKKVDP